jgi:membrane-associated protease RseP (regulator of RpoE activity)
VLQSGCNGLGVLLILDLTLTENLSLNTETSVDETTRREPTHNTREYLVHAALFALTFVTTAIAGVQWLNKDPLELTNFPAGVSYAVLILLMLGSHEFGHYIAARIHGMKSTLPYFLPFPSFLGIFPFGTLGAVIRLKSPIPSRKVIFDVGSAGPLAGFLVSMVILIIGFLTLPSIDYLFSIHPEYAQMERIPTEGLTFGRSIFYSLFAWLFAPSGAYVPPMSEVYHYPFLCIGWFGMFVTAMNLIPIGQLDGGHISFAMFGTRYHLIAQVSLVLLVLLGSAGFLPLLNIPFEFGWTGWLFWALLLIGFMRLSRMNRPHLDDDTPLDPVRMFIGWICVLVFIGSFSLTPIEIR